MRTCQSMVLASLAAWIMATSSIAEAQFPAPGEALPADAPQPADEAMKEAMDVLTQPEAPQGLVRLAEDYDIWADMQRKLVVVDGTICLREGYLEMFACPRGTKEHESIVAVNAPSRFVHAGLLAVGAEPGQPVQFHPEYQSAEGTRVDVYVLWKDEEGNRHRARAQDWIRYDRTGEEMPYHWVFAGSSLWKDESTGMVHYQGDAGDLICVSNFPTATLDLPVKSPQANVDLLFTAFTERIPPLETKVRLVLYPHVPRGQEKVDGQQSADQQPAEEKPEEADVK